MRTIFLFRLFIVFTLVTSCKKKDSIVPKDDIEQTGFSRMFGGTGNEKITDILVSQNKVYVLGYTTSYGKGSNDVVLVCYTLFGQQLWYKTYGTSSSETANDISETSDGNYLITGNKASQNGYVLKVDPNGEILWQKVISENTRISLYGGVEQSGFYFFSGTVYFVEQGGYTTPYSTEGIYFLKLDVNGNVIKTKWYGSFISTYPSYYGGRILASSNGYITTLGAFSANSNDNNVHPFSVDQNLDYLGSRSIDPSYSWNSGNIIEAKNGNYIVTYKRSAKDPLFNLAAREIEPVSKNTVWLLDTGSTKYEGGEDVCEINGGYVFAGNIETAVSNEHDIYLVYTDLNGNITKTKTLSLPGDQWVKGIEYDKGWLYLAASDNSKGDYNLLTIKILP